MDSIVASAIKKANKMKAENHPRWARVIADALFEAGLISTHPGFFVPIITRHFPRLAETNYPDGVIADIVSALNEATIC